MNFLAQQNHVSHLVRDENNSKGIWPLDLKKLLINQGCQQTADLLPPEEVPILRKSKTVNITISVSEYAIDDTPFSLSAEFRAATGVQVSDGTTMRWCSWVDPDLGDSASPYLKGNKYEPTCWIAANSADAKERALNIRPVPAGNITSGLKLYYMALVNALSADGDISVLPVQFHELPCWYAAALLLAKEQVDGALQNAMRYWKMWRDRLVGENAKYNRGIEVPPLTPEK